MKTVGHHIRKKRLDDGLYQREAAELIGVSAAVVELWEIRGYEPDPRSWPGVIASLGYDPNPKPSTPAERIKTARRLLGLTQKELANRLLADAGAITRWEAGGEIRKYVHRSAVREMFTKLGLDGA